jgi:hypothetical protein
VRLWIIVEPALSNLGIVWVTPLRTVDQRSRFVLAFAHAGVRAQGRDV